ncbi:Crp/Fnr family transcriptional regulator [Pistricoccus aurantiacus]|uniref:Crp/Fnr family transcriptional regulator n=1 Tax=Pistricoccus aurantiacus TaxID=1883414 RepID=UPI003642E8B4
MIERFLPLHNQLLAALPSEVQERLFPHLKLIRLPLGKLIHQPGNVPRNVYFPIDAIISLIYVMDSGASAEIAIIGKDGLAGLSVIMGGEITNSRTVVQSAGHAYQLDNQRFRDEFDRHGALLELMLRYIQTLMDQMAQTAVCNRFHTIDQQFCRWLLHSLDRLPGDQLVMTQELIANMLGVRREGVALAARKLHKQGVIEYNRGRIKVLNRPALERLSCECYAAIKEEAERLLPYPADQKSQTSWRCGKA